MFPGVSDPELPRTVLTGLAPFDPGWPGGSHADVVSAPTRQFTTGARLTRPVSWGDSPIWESAPVAAGGPWSPRSQGADQARWMTLNRVVTTGSPVV